MRIRNWETFWKLARDFELETAVTSIARRDALFEFKSPKYTSFAFYVIVKQELLLVWQTL